MRRAILLLVMAAAVVSGTRGADERTIPSTISNVTVFLSGAQVERTATTEIPKGTSRLVFGGLSAEADPGSIQVRGTGGFTILSVQHRMDHGKPPEGPEAVKTLEAAIKGIEREIQDEQNRITVLQNEEQRLLKNESFDGGAQGLSVERIKAVNDYFRERITAVREGILTKQRHIAELTENAQRQHLQLEQLQGRKPKAYSEVVVEIASDRAVTSTMTLRYVVRSAGWTPQYDIRVDNVNAPLALTYKANVYQSTGEDWSKVHLELSSGDPQQSGVMPVMGIWRLGANTPPPEPVRPLANYNATVRQVNGIVRDSRTGEPLPFVSAAVTTADGTALNGTQSNFDGYYAVAVPPGGHTIVFSYLGFETQRLPISSGNMNVQLAQSAVELSSVEVVRYKVPSIDKDAGASMTRITQEQISRMPARSIASVATTVRGARADAGNFYVDGVQVGTGGIPANHGDVINALPEVATRQGHTQFTFVIALPYSIPSDGQGHLVAVKEHQVPSVYRYYCTPKLDPSAYLFAKASGWDRLDLLAGPVNLYFEGTFIGESFLDVAQVKDTLDISLGQDHAVIVQRTKQQELGKRTFTGSKRLDTIGWAIEVRNKKATAIDVVINDQIPVPVLGEIEVELLENDATAKDQATGFLTWRDHLGPSASAKHGFTYSVKAPKQMALVLE
ncbi:MAG TPA: mucoidy inhibitor MuiA family protein [Flavobacteriales bacterium]